MWRLLIFLIFISCKRKENDLAVVEWLQGTWLGKTGESQTFIETWKKDSPVSLSGSGITLENGDTIFTEDLKINLTDTGIFYLAAPGNEKPTAFKLVDVSEKHALFKNPEHDFPTEIEYRLFDKDSLVATVSGKINSKDKAISFYLKKQ